MDLIEAPWQDILHGIDFSSLRIFSIGFDDSFVGNEEMTMQFEDEVDRSVRAYVDILESIPMVLTFDSLGEQFFEEMNELTQYVFALLRRVHLENQNVGPAFDGAME
ncbi:hypothetical protein SUGI_0728670 [Cryptomeria japonica]|nr:hypothetical protein SUGI_0728670 [Cryptomeria japonica]